MIFERFPGQLLAAELSDMPFEIERLAILYVAPIHNHKLAHLWYCRALMEQ